MSGVRGKKAANSSGEVSKAAILRYQKQHTDEMISKTAMPMRMTSRGVTVLRKELGVMMIIEGRNPFSTRGVT